MHEDFLKRIVFLCYSGEQHCYTIVPQADFFDHLSHRNTLPDVTSDRFPCISFDDMQPGDIFFDLDGVWNTVYTRRSYVLPELKARGIKIAVYIYDIIPVTHPQYCHQNTVYNYLDYLGAHLQYADLIIVSAQSTLDRIDELYKQLGTSRHAKGIVSWLGADLIARDATGAYPGGSIPSKVLNAATKRFILAVGTIEPRKNHAYLLDAFEAGLFEDGINLIFAGRIGWNVDTLKERMDQLPERDKHFFFFEGLDDAAIDYLYENALFVAFPSFEEGFGLPIVEALQHATPVLASDIPVLREVGADYCDYFDIKDPNAFVALVRHYMSHPDAYSVLKEKVKSYVPVAWCESTERIENALQTLTIPERKPLTDINQMVFLTSRVESIEKTLPFIDHLMPFIEEVVLCCPDDKRDQMKHCYHGRLKITVLTDSEILSGRALPADHGKRNFLLRCLMMRRPEINNVFIMSDDDYRPLREIDRSFFVDGMCYKAYYFYDIRKWNGTVAHMSSYDILHFHTREFLLENQYPTKQYSSHMPQVIDKDIYMEMLRNHPGIEDFGLDEWSSYFNYAQFKYPDLIQSIPYETLSWPADGRSWKQDVYQETYSFENYYDFMYQEEGIFKGFSDTYHNEIIAENDRKIKAYEAHISTFIDSEKAYREYVKKYEVSHRSTPSYVLMQQDDDIKILLPVELTLHRGGHIKLPFIVMIDEDGFEMNWEIHTKRGVPLQRGVSFGGNYILDQHDLTMTEGRFDLSVVISQVIRPGKYVFHIVVYHEDQIWSSETRINIV